MIGVVLKLLGFSAQTPLEAADVAEKVERSIEDRMKSVTARIKAGGYSTLNVSEMDELADDLAKILEFVETALRILNGAKPEIGLDHSLQRLRYIRTRVMNLKSTRDGLAMQQTS